MISLPTNNGEEYPITQTMLSEYSSLYPAVDVLQELRKARGWLLSNRARRKTSRGMLRFVNGWLAKEQDRGGTGPPPAPDYRPPRNSLDAALQRQLARIDEEERRGQERSGVTGRPNPLAIPGRPDD